jgi:hypothetical protein
LVIVINSGITPNGLRRVKKEVKQSKANEKRLSFIGAYYMKDQKY